MVNTGGHVAAAQHSEAGRPFQVRDAVLDLRGGFQWTSMPVSVRNGTTLGDDWAPPSLRAFSLCLATLTWC
jgi:hypothetical protein